MKTVGSNKITQAICTILMVLVSTSLVFAYPPDNAAVLYYRASLNYTTNSTMEKKLLELIKGNIGIDEEIKAYVQSNKNWIKQFVDAGESPNCDWGIDYSEGITLLMPPYAPIRNMARIVLAQAKISADSADYKQALDLCLSIHKAGAHLADGGLLISHLVGISLNSYANQCITDIIPQISDKPDMLIWLKSQIDDVSQKLPSVKAAVNRDLRICAQDIRRDKIDNIFEMLGEDVPEKQRQIIRDGDDAFFKASKQYFMEYLSDSLTAVDLPYSQSYKQLVKLREKPGIESKKNPNAIIAAHFAPATDKVIGVDIKARTHFNAIKTALHLYIMRAKAGRLPDSLPVGLPMDLFSGKDFEYEKTKDGFVLRCRGKDLDKDKIYEYEFKIPK
ncbi:MAG: hypothetical protein D4R45_03610 [Planctomycetaceae bacterium]|nr:MAG: hypothetical protein D4R45_03610 [Planctomycetaceae bacterium]